MSLELAVHGLRIEAGCLPATDGVVRLVELNAQGVGRRVDGLAHKEVEHAGGGLGGRLFLIDTRRLDKIDLLLITFVGNDQLAPNLAQAVYGDIRRRVLQTVLVVHVEVDEHGVGGRNVQMVAIGAQVGAFKE